MKTGKLACGVLALTLAACTQAPEPVAPTPAPPPLATAAPVPLAPLAAEPAIDPGLVATAQLNLKALGYAAGKPSDVDDPLFHRAILEFEKDQGLTEDGRLGPAVVDRLKAMRAALAKTAADDNRSAVFIYSDGSMGRQALGFLIPPPKGLVSDAPAKFLQPLKPGAQASYHLGHRAKDGSVSADITITCRVGRAAQINVPLGLVDAIAVECRGDGSAANLPQWRSIYSSTMGAVVRQETPKGVRDLVAIRPLTSDWPSAARTGLDWALTHTLEAAATSAPVQWSSTAVAPHFEIRATAKLSGQEVGLSGRYAPEFCRRFEMAQTDNPSARYPGIACQNADGIWSLPGSTIQLATPVSGIGTRPATPALRSAQN